MAVSQPKPIASAPALPAPDTDFYQVTEALNQAELDILQQVRAFMKAYVAPVITKYWAEDAFPFEVLPALRDLNIASLGY
ncbi:MAG: glutaryl-CoA dehydrogenase, partial [Candidatus Binataceae bacterium]|nr:glutaryl-CoA dehydrogenase [Candidatus Binataceae bacterium]